MWQKASNIFANAIYSWQLTNHRYKQYAKQQMRFLRLQSAANQEICQLYGQNSQNIAALVNKVLAIHSRLEEASYKAKLAFARAWLKCAGLRMANYGQFPGEH